jgi:ABC-type branched-subunit amino acid transport system substrate-binding protein
MRAKMGSKFYASVFILFLAAAMVTGFSIGPAQGATQEPIKLGILTDLTGPGSPMVVAMDEWAFKDYFDWVNSKGGIMGHPVKCIVVDTQYKMDKIISGYENLVGQGIVGMMLSLSPGLEGMKERFTKDRVCVVSGTSNTKSMWPARYIYQTWPTYADQAGFIVDRIIDQAIAKNRDLKKNPLRIAWMYADNPMGRAILPAIRYAEARGCVTAAEAGVPMIPTDTTPDLRRIKASDAEALVMGVLPSSAAITIKDAIRIGFNIPFYATGMTKLDGVIHYAGVHLAPGFNGMDTSVLWYSEFQQKHPLLKTAMDLLKTKHPDGLSEPWKYLDGWQKGMIMEQALKNAIKKKGWPIEGADVKNGMDELKNFDMEGTNSNVTMYRDVDNRGSVMCKWYKIVKKQKGLETLALVEEASDWLPAPTVLPEGFEAQCPGLKELCMKNGWTYYSPESGLILKK